MNMKKILLALFAGAIGTAVMSFSAMAADITVKNDSELEAALGTAAAGDTIILEAGEYQAFELARHSQLNFKGMGGATVIASGTNSCYWPCVTGTVENIVFKAADDYSYPYNFSAIIFAQDTNNGEPSDITFKNCDFISSNGNSGIHFVGDVDFYGCDFVGNNSYSAMNYCCPSGDGIVIDGCTFNGTYSFASIHLAEGAGADTTISDCEINTGLIEFGSPKNIEFSENVINSTINLWSENKVVFDNNEFGEDAKVSANSEKAVATILPTNTYADGMTVEDIVVSETDGAVEIPVAMIGDEYFLTFADAVKAAAKSATESTPVTVRLAKGTFTESITLPFNIGYITFKGADNHGTILKNSSVGHNGAASGKMTNITFDGIVFDNSNINLTAIYENTKIQNMTINNCKFLNVTGKTAVSFNTNSLPNLVGFTFTNNVIDGVTGGSFSGLVLRAAPTGDIVITGNEISNVAWNAIQLVNLTADANVTITDNTLSSGASEGVLNIYNAKCGITLEDNTINTLEGQPAIAGFAPVAKIGDKQYTTLDAAIAEADGAKITLLSDAELNTKLSNDTINIDLNGYTMFVNVGANYIIGDNSILGGTVDISKASSSQNIFGLAQCATPATTLTMDKVNFVGNGYNSGYAVFEIGNSGADVSLTITDSTIDLKNDNADQGGFVKGYGANCVLVIEDTDVTLDNTDMFNVNVSANITDSEFTITNLSDTAFRNLGGTIDNTVISVTNSGNGIRNTSTGYNLDVTNNSSIKISGSTITEEGKAGDLVLAAGNKVNTDATSELLVETSTIADWDDISGNVVSKADTIYIQYRRTDVERNADGTIKTESDGDIIDTLEGADTYEIILAGYNSEKINELASADITFKFVGTPYEGAKMDYTVTPVKGVALTQLGDSDRFMFNYNGIDKYEETGAAIVIGTIEVSGYGKYYLGTDATVTTNAVYATEIRDNIVEGFDAAGKLVVNADMDENDQMVGEVNDVEIVVPTRELMINITFPNAVENRAYEYQQMTVKVFGGDLDEALVIGLGETPSIPDVLSIYKDKTDCEVEVVFENGAYEIEIDELLTLSNAYMVEVSGEGYRTARYTVTMTEDKTLNFWNNVKDNAINVEEGKDSSAKTVTFLAGDIVKDNDINIYDLSAVVSYFGEEGLGVDKRPEYAKYDLNRDGKIDSKDVAYVLVSWGK